MLSRTILTLLLSLYSLWGLAQVKLYGEVTHNAKPLDQVTIQVYESGKFQRTIAASKKGKYDMEFPENHRYVLVFRRPFMVPVRISVNTALGEKQGSVQELAYEVPLNMEMYYRYEGMDESAYEGPIGEVCAQGEGKNTFSFRPDKQRMEKIKAMNDLSLRMEAEGRQPLADAEEKEAGDNAETKGIPAKSMTAVQAEGAREDEKRDARVTDPHEREKELRIDRQADRYGQIEQANEETSARARDMQERSQAARTDHGDVREHYIVTSKQTRSEVLAGQKEQEDKTLDAKVEKQERLMTEIEHAARQKAAAARAQTDENTYGVSRRMDEGWFYTEEVLRVSECGTRNEYKHITYHWLIIDTDYYYLNDSEITKEMYEEARQLFK